MITPPCDDVPTILSAQGAPVDVCTRQGLQVRKHSSRFLNNKGIRSANQPPKESSLASLAQARRHEHRAENPTSTWR